MVLDILLIMAGVLALTFAAMLLKAAFFNPIKPEGKEQVEERSDCCPDGAAERLAGAIRIVTVNSKGGSEPPADELLKLHDYLKVSYPACFSSMSVSLHNNYSLLLRWKGRDEALEPMLLMGHMDVVPVEASTINQWEHEPFSGDFADGFIWGRGALDCKNVVCGLMEAAESLIGSGYMPRRSIYFAFGHDEETGGGYGAASIADVLRKQGTKLHLILDEGGRVDSPGLFTGKDAEAIVSIAEKGYASFKLEADIPGGHSSRPPKATAPGLLIDACSKISSYRFRTQLRGPFGKMLRFAGPEMGFWKRLAIANLWITKPFVIAWLSSDPRTDCLIRTTAVVTMLNCGVKDNVIPAHAEAIVNTRPTYGSKPEAIRNDLASIIGDNRIKISPIGAQIPPSKSANLEDERFAPLMATISSHFPGACIIPAILTGGTDTKHFADLSEAIFRFVPVKLSHELASGVHGINERIAEEAYCGMVSFYIDFMKLASA